jgi:TolA-binding protein
MRRGFYRSVAAVLAAWALSPAQLLRADSLLIQSGTGNPIQLGDVKITGITEGAVEFTTGGGRQTSKPLEQVPQITLDDEPTFSAAEDSFHTGQFGPAIENYLKALGTTQKPWLADRIGLRLIQAGDKANNYPAAVNGFVALMQRSPTMAVQNKPAIPADKSNMDPAIAALKQAVANPKASADQKTALNNYLVEIYNARGDTKAASATLGQMENSSPTGAAVAAENRVVNADLKLTEARQLFAQRQFGKAAQLLDSNGSLFNDPQQRADALYLLAQCTAADTSADPNHLKDAALGYMRVVAVCSQLPGKPHVPESLLAVGKLEEQMKNSAEASAVYKQITDEFKNSPAAGPATDALARLGKPGAK